MDMMMIKITMALVIVALMVAIFFAVILGGLGTQGVYT
jgi:hypothetical protein